MYYLIYVSHATKAMTEGDLLELLVEARNNNLKLDITGMLLYQKGQFMQMLEGDRLAVVELYNDIIKDARHHEVVTIMDGMIEKRSFPDWSMGFKQMDEMSSMLPFDDYVKQTLGTSSHLQETQSAFEFMRLFYQAHS